MTKLDELLRPIIESQVSVPDMAKILNEMFAAAVSSAPVDEIDNFSAKRFSPVFLALSGMLENIRRREKKAKSRKNRP